MSEIKTTKVDSKEFIQTEYKLINLMLRYNTIVDDVIADGIVPDLFEPYNKKIVECIFKEYVRTKGGKLTENAFKEILKEQLNRNEISNTDFLSFVQSYRKSQMAQASEDDVNHLKRSLREASTARNLPDLLKKVSNNAITKGWVSAAITLKEDIEQMVQLTETKNTKILSLQDTQNEYVTRIKRLREHPEEIVRCHIPEIDEAIRVGFKPEMMTLFVADTSFYKTTIMLNIALNIWEKDNKTVLYIPLEQRYLELTDKIVSNRANIHADLLARPEKLTDEHIKRIEEMTIWMQKSNSFCIFDTDERVSPNQLKSEIKKYVNVFQPKVVVIDYISILKSDKRHDSRSLEIEDILRELRFMGRKFGFHIISAAQMGRDTIKRLRQQTDTKIDSTASRESHGFSTEPDNVIAMTPGDAPDVIIGHIIKARYGAKGGTFELKADGAYSRILSTSNSLNMAQNSIDPQFSMDAFMKTIEVSTEDVNKVVEDPDWPVEFDIPEAPKPNEIVIESNEESTDSLEGL